MKHSNKDISLPNNIFVANDTMQDDPDGNYFYVSKISKDYKTFTDILIKHRLHSMSGCNAQFFTDDAGNVLGCYMNKVGKVYQSIRFTEGGYTATLSSIDHGDYDDDDDDDDDGDDACIYCGRC